MMSKPTVVRPAHLAFLDALRRSGVTNMFGAVPYLKARFPKLSEKDARTVLMYWMDSFRARQQGDAR